MTETIPSLTQTAAWKALEAHSQENRNLTIKDLFAEDSTRGHRLTVEAAGIYFD
jgi:glucose-6-phosphate isomerase